MSESPLRVAVVGYGLAGRVFHAPLVAAEPDMQVAAIVTSDPERRAPNFHCRFLRRLFIRAADHNIAKLAFDRLGALACENIVHVLQSFATAAAITLHVDVLEGSNDHHRAEAC